LGRAQEVGGSNCRPRISALLIEQCNEWLVARRYLSVESLALILEDQGEEERREVIEPLPPT